MRVLFMGSGDIALPSFLWLLSAPEIEVVALVTQPDKPVGRHQILTDSPIKQAALQANVPVLQPLKIREPEVLQQIRNLVPDYIVVMAYGQILPKTLLDTPKIACLNLHASLLPRHRGASPIQSAILAGDGISGITLMHMDVGLDTGDIVLTHKIPIFPTDTGGILHDRLAEVGPSVLEKGLALFQSGNATRTPQNPELVTLSGKLNRDSGHINWTQPAPQIERQIRAMHPWPGAFSILPAGKKLKIHSAQIVSESGGQPGEIVRADQTGILVATGDGTISLNEIQLEGRSRMSAVDFLRGNPLQPHTFLS